MIIELGHYALVLALATAIIQGVLPVLGVRRGDPSLMGLAANAALVCFLLVAFSFAVLTFAYVTSDFSVKNVWENSHSLKPLIYKITGVWGNHDEQTHLIPETEPELRRIAYMLGFEDTASFSNALSRVLRTVERRYAQLFEQEAKLSTETGNLVFTGQQDDPDTLETLKKLGFQRPSDIANIIRTWHYGRYRATQSVEARERLTELTPELLRVFGESRRADEAFLRFDHFLSGLPAGIQLFSLLGNNPGLLSLIVNIMVRPACPFLLF